MVIVVDPFRFKGTLLKCFVFESGRKGNAGSAQVVVEGLEPSAASSFTSSKRLLMERC